jgi:hypothetical protein
MNPNPILHLLACSSFHFHKLPLHSTKRRLHTIMRTTSPQACTQHCYCQSRTNIKMSHPSRATSLPAREDNPGWPNEFGTKGYAAHLAAVESQCSIAQTDTNLGANEAGVEPSSPSSSSSSSLSAWASPLSSLIPTSNSIYSITPRTATSRTRNSRESSTELLGQGDSDPRGQLKPVVQRCQIINGSPELLVEVGFLGDLERLDGLSRAETLIGKEETCSDWGKVGRMKEKTRRRKQGYLRT